MTLDQWLTFFQNWFLIALAASLFRGKMIWQEKGKAYRFFLILACAPAGLVFNVASGVVWAVIKWTQGMIQVYEGNEPGVEK